MIFGIGVGLVVVGIRWIGWFCVGGAVGIVGLGLFGIGSSCGLLWIAIVIVVGLFIVVILFILDNLIPLV